MDNKDPDITPDEYLIPRYRSIFDTKPYRGQCIMVGHELIHGGGKSRWCKHCDKTEHMNYEGVWI